MGHNFLSNIFNEKNGHWIEKQVSNTTHFVKNSGKKILHFADNQVSKFTNVLSSPLFIIGAVVVVGGILYVVSR